MVHLEKMSTFENGEVLKRYRISEPYTVIDCLKAMIRNPDVALGHGEREGDHDVGFDSDSDHDCYSSVQEILESVDYERYNPRFNVYNSYYFSFQNKWAGHRPRPPPGTGRSIPATAGSA